MEQMKQLTQKWVSQTKTKQNLTKVTYSTLFIFVHLSHKFLGYFVQPWLCILKASVKRNYAQLNQLLIFMFKLVYRHLHHNYRYLKEGDTAYRYSNINHQKDHLSTKIYKNLVHQSFYFYLWSTGLIIDPGSNPL